MGTKVKKQKSGETKSKNIFLGIVLILSAYSPTDYYEYGSDYHKSNREVMRFDLRKVRESDVMLVNLKDIRKSVGSCDEIFYAYILGKPIIGFIEDDIDGEELINYVHEWKYEQIDRIETGENALETACEYIKDYYF